MTPAILGPAADPDRWQFPTVGLSDLAFSMRRVPRQSSIGRLVHRQVPFGMPALRPDMVDCAFFLYARDEMTKKMHGPLGTGCIVGRKSETLEGEMHYYGVTNWHVANRENASIIRINTRDGGSRFIELSPFDWHFLPRGDDLCVVDLTDELNLATDKISFVNETLFISEKVILAYDIGVGEDGFMLGLLPNVDAGKRNKPAARFGNLALVADEEGKIAQPNKMHRPSHLMDMRSRTGFSGSPVFLYRTPSDDLTEVPNTYRLAEDKQWFGKDQGLYEIKNFFVGLLGIHCGQFWDKVEVYKSPPESEKLNDPIHEGDHLYIHGGMTIVVPAWRISELLNLEVFEMARDEQDRARRTVALNRPRAESVVAPRDGSVETPDANPNHQEDFTRLVDAAARKRPQGG
jgi:hypothetical protein